MQPDTTATPPPPQATTAPTRPSGPTPYVLSLGNLVRLLSELTRRQGVRITELEVQLRAIAGQVQVAADNRALVDAIERLSEHVGGGIDHGFRTVCARMDH